MVTFRLEKLIKNVCSTGGVTLDELFKEAETIGIKKKYAEEALGVLASEGSIKIKSGIVSLVK